MNINPGNNQELMDKCRTLKEYMIFVEKVRKYRKLLSLEQAVERAVTECMDEAMEAGFQRGIEEGKAE